MGTVLWRNVTNSSRRFIGMVVYSSHDLNNFEFLVKNSQRQLVKEEPRQKSTYYGKANNGYAYSGTVEPRTQLKFLLDIGKRFKLGAGKYTVAVLYRSSYNPGRMDLVCASGEANIQILPRPKSSGQ